MPFGIVGNRSSGVIRFGSGEKITAHVTKFDGESIQIRGQHEKQSRVIRLSSIETITVHAVGEDDNGPEAV